MGSVFGSVRYRLDVLTQRVVPRADAATELPADAVKLQSQFMTDARQLTFEGRRAGEGYFSKDGRHMVFQSEREPGNPFFQIYLMDRETGDVHRVSPGRGKTTCAWISPAGDKVLFASTQYDPQATEKQAAEYELRNSPNKPRYSWDYDPTYELVRVRSEVVRVSQAHRNTRIRCRRFVLTRRRVDLLRNRNRRALLERTECRGAGTLQARSCFGHGNLLHAIGWFRTEAADQHSGLRRAVLSSRQTERDLLATLQQR